MGYKVLIIINEKSFSFLFFRIVDFLSSSRFPIQLSASDTNRKEEKVKKLYRGNIGKSPFEQNFHY